MPRTLVVGVSLPSDYALIRIASDWSGHGRVFWLHGDAIKYRDFQLDPVLIAQLLVTRESRSSNASVWQRVLRHQNQVLGPPIEEALIDVPEAQFE